MDTGVSLRTALQTTATGTRGVKVLASMVEQRLASTRISQPSIRLATLASGPRGLAIRAGIKLLGRTRATQVQSIARQTAARPGVRVGGIGVGVVGAERIIEATTGRSPARMAFDLARKVATDRIAAARGRDRLDTGFIPTKKPGIPFKPDFPGGFTGGHRMPSQALAVQHVAVRQWQTFPGGPVFTRFQDGHIEVQRKDGTVKHFRPYRPVVIPRKWDARSMRRVATALKRQRKTATKILQLTGGVPKKTVRVSAREHRSVDV